MSTKKAITQAPRPEQYHLDEAPKLRTRWREEAAALHKEADAMREAAFRAAIAKHGIRIPKDAKLVATRYSNSMTLGFGKITIRVPDGSFNRGSDSLPPAIRKVESAAHALDRKAQGLCKIISTTAARQFGSFCRTKYGPKPDLATIKRAYGEWLDLQLNCKC